MFASQGFFLLYLSLITSVYGVVSAVCAAKLRHVRLFRSARTAATATCVQFVLAAACMWYMLYSRDYSIKYIFENSSNDLPPMYTLSAFWSALEGSHFFWSLLLAIFSCIAHWTYAKDNEHIMPYVSAVLQGVMVWMCYLLVSYSDPFLPISPVPANGQGMNALLQNPYMAFHPPSLFTGYTVATIPFAYSMAALCYGDITEGWLRTVRRWAVFGWIAQTIGVFLGGRWAYVELGWAGYWAWDPVENSSFMPWLFYTALLHSLLVQDKIGHMKRASIVLSTLTFFFAFFGTFITRSGVISSVHSFAQSPIGPNYLIFLSILMVLAAGLYAFRAPSILPTETDKAWGFSRESVLVVTLFIILTFAAIIFIGTVYPIVSEAITGARFNIQAPYFNAFAPWVGLGFVTAIGVGNLVRYRSGKLVGGLPLQAAAVIFGVLFAWAMFHLGDLAKSHTPFALGAQLVGMWMVGWCSLCLTYEVFDRIRAIKFNFALFFKRNLSYLGAYIAHIGVLAAILGFLGNFRSLQKDVTLRAGESAELYGYKFTFTGVEAEESANAVNYVAPLVMSKDGKEIGLIKPARSKYPTKPEMLHEIGLEGHFWHDTYVVMSDFDQQDGKTATFQLHINPTVRVVWISAVIMVLGGLLSLFDRFRGVKSRDNVAGAWELENRPDVARGDQLAGQHVLPSATT
jgi:cytochrome c-type biogenesis protein CcmF